MQLYPQEDHQSSVPNLRKGSAYKATIDPPSKSYQAPFKSTDLTKGSMRLERDYCKAHPDEEINYFCFECLCQPICSECVIHGEHKGHNVQTIKKSYPIITDKLEDLVIHISSKIDDLHVVENRLEARKREVIDQTNTIKQKMANAFEDI